MKPLILFHRGCWDGFCAAWVARKALGDIEAVSVQYGEPPTDVANRDVFILDFSYSRNVLLQMKDEAKSLVVLDHHKTAQEELVGLGFCTFDMGKSGGRLAWEYFHMSQDGFMSIPASPWLVDYTEDRDLWRHKLEDSQAVNAALRSYPLDFELWDGFAKQHPTDFTPEGEAIRRRERQIVEAHLLHARDIEIDGYRVPAVNATVLYSEIAGELAKGKPFAAAYFDRQDGKRQWSLRSDENGLDVGKIAKSFGGGGHAHASGYET